MRVGLEAEQIEKELKIRMELNVPITARPDLYNTATMVNSIIFPIL